jgi:hypothetical protein
MDFDFFQFSPSSWHIIPLRSKYRHKHVELKHDQSDFCAYVRDNALRQYKSTGKITERRGRLVNTVLRIREVPGSNLGPKTAYLGCGFSWLSSVLPGKYRDSTLKLDHHRFHPRPFQIIT